MSTKRKTSRSREPRINKSSVDHSTRCPSAMCLARGPRRRVHLEKHPPADCLLRRPLRSLIPYVTRRSDTTELQGSIEPRCLNPPRIGSGSETFTVARQGLFDERPDGP